VKKFNIVEIENSYLNFFTPAVIIATGIFLSNLFSWPASFLYWIIDISDMNVNLDLVKALVANINGVLICLIVYFVFIPHLKVKDVTFRDSNIESFYVVLPVFLIIIFFRIILTFLFEQSGSTIYLMSPWFLSSYSLLLDPSVLILFILYQFFIIPVYTELLYRRTVIPLLEDRGLSPLLAVVLSSLGFCLLFLPEYLATSNYMGTLYWFGSTFLFGLATGFIYIITRNILFPILYAAIYYVYRFTYDFGTFFRDKNLLFIHLFLNIIILIIGFMILIFIIWHLVNRESHSRWVNIIKTPSASKITRGVIGYFIISVILVSIHLIAKEYIASSTSSNILGAFIFNTAFYLLAFSIPFWLTITSEYAQY